MKKDMQSPSTSNQHIIKDANTGSLLSFEAILLSYSMNTCCIASEFSQGQ